MSKKTEEMVTLEEKRNENEDKVSKALKFVQDEWKKLRDAAVGANLVAAEVKVAIGKRLLMDFYDNNWRRVLDKENENGEKYLPAKNKLWKDLLGRNGFPIKSKQGMLNILRCGAQARWAELDGISLEGIEYTMQVHLTRLENGDQKKEVIELIKSGKGFDKDGKEVEKEWHSRDVDNYVRKLTVKPTTLAENFDKVIFKGEEFKTALTTDFLDAIKRYQDYNPEMPETKANYVIAQDRKEVRKAIEDTIKKFQEALDELRKAKETLKEKNPDARKGSRKKKDVTIPDDIPMEGDEAVNA